MATEIEKKYRLNAAQKASISDALEEIGAEFAGADFEENILYAGGELREKEAVLRLRRIGERTILTYKQKVPGDFAAKHYLEHETEVADFEEIARVFESLGFRPALVYEKHRRTWKFKAVEIVLDTLPFGEFMEIEGPVTAIEEAEILLGAEDFEVEERTYPKLTRQYGRENGELTEARFA